jgi:hypothetical protein
MSRSASVEIIVEHRCCIWPLILPTASAYDSSSMELDRTVMVTVWDCTDQLEPSINSNSCHERQHGAAVVLLRTFNSGLR